MTIQWEALAAVALVSIVVGVLVVKIAMSCQGETRTTSCNSRRQVGCAPGFAAIWRCWPPAQILSFRRRDGALSPGGDVARSGFDLLKRRSE
jgi:hypothetical protein